MMRLGKIFAPALAAMILLASVPAAATVIAWDTVGGNVSGWSGDGHSLMFTETVGGESRHMWAGAFSLGLGGVSRRQLGVHGDSGLGVHGGFDRGWPDHALDNSWGLDFILFDFGVDNFNPLGLTIGWHHNDSDLLVWIMDALDPGLMRIDNLLSLDDLRDGEERLLNTALTGRYMMVSGGLGDFDPDYVKISQVSGRIVQQVPEPGTVALMLAGLLGLGLLIRRPATGAVLRPRLQD